jgi:hypothetical protein
VLISPRDRTVEVWTRGDSWSVATYREGEIARLAVGAALDVHELLT